MNSQFYPKPSTNKSSQIPFSRLWVESICMIMIMGLLSLATGCSQEVIVPVEEPIEQAIPTISHIFPTHAKAGEVIQIYGENFGEDAGRVRVYINETTARFEASPTNKLLKVKVPEFVGTGKVVVEVDEVSVEGPVFTYDN